jgi:hypothetical protein
LTRATVILDLEGQLTIIIHENDEAAARAALREFIETLAQSGLEIELIDAGNFLIVPDSQGVITNK